MVNGERPIRFLWFSDGVGAYCGQEYHLAAERDLAWLLARPEIDGLDLRAGEEATWTEGGWHIERIADRIERERRGRLI